MTDGKLHALRRDPTFRALRGDSLRSLGRLVDLVDVPPGEVLSPANAPPHWGFYCSSGLLHVLIGGCVAPQAVPPVLFLPTDLRGTALVAALPSRVVVLPARAVDQLFSLAPGLRAVRRYEGSVRTPQEVS